MSTGQSREQEMEQVTKYQDDVIHEAQAEIARLRNATEFNHGCGECASEAGLTHLESTGALCSSHAARLREENERLTEELNFLVSPQQEKQPDA